MNNHNHKDNPMKKILAALFLATLFGAPAFAGNPDADRQEADVVVEGDVKVESDAHEHADHHGDGETFDDHAHDDHHGEEDSHGDHH